MTGVDYQQVIRKQLLPQNYLKNPTPSSIKHQLKGHEMVETTLKS
jgi:hypothetical protein